MTNQEAISKGRALGSKRAKIEALQDELKLLLNDKNKIRNLLHRKAEQKFGLGSQELKRAKADIEAAYDRDVATLKKRFGGKIKRIRNSKKAVPKTMLGKLKQLGGETSSIVKKTWKKIPGKGPVAIGGAILITAVAAATYKRYRELEQERLKRLKHTLQKRLEAKAKKYE